MSERRQKLQLLADLQERTRRARAAPIKAYTPHAGQIRAHEATKRKRITLVTCGNRWGKSHFNAVETVQRLYGYRISEVPDIELTHDGDYPPKEQIPREYWYVRPDGIPMETPCKWRVITGLGMVEGIMNTMHPKIEEQLPLAVRSHPDYIVRRGQMSCPNFVQLPNGSTLHYGSAEQKPAMFEGSDFAGATLDEPPNQSIWTPVWRGLIDQYGSVVITATPAGSVAAACAWLFDEMLDGDLSDLVEHITGSMHDNPYISAEARGEFLRGLSKEERDAREHGIWSGFTFRALPTFNEHAHVIPRMSPRDLPGNWTYMCVSDPAHRRPYAFIWLAFEPRQDGQIWVVDEWPENQWHHEMRNSDMTVRDYAKMIRQKEFRPSHYRVLDPRFGKAAPRIKGERHTSIQDDFAAEGLYFDCQFEGTESEETGIERLRQALQYDKDSILSPLNRPRLRVFDHCRNTIKALQYSNFVPPAVRNPDNLPEKLNEKYKDFRDCLRYGILYNFVPQGRSTNSYIDLAELRKHNNYH